MSEQFSITGSSSPIKIKCLDVMKRKSKKTTNPLLVLLQRGFYSSKKKEFLRQNSKEEKCQPCSTDSDLISTFGMTEESETKQFESFCLQEGCSTPTCNQISVDVSGSLPVSPSDSEKSLFWINTVSNSSRRSSGISRIPSASSEASRRQSFSTSYTSWTKPIAGNKISDSYFPASSILDNDVEDDKNGGHLEEPYHMDRSMKKLKRLGSMNLRRNSSADTCKDIDDIEDFELDGFDNCELAFE